MHEILVPCPHLIHFFIGQERFHVSHNGHASSTCRDRTAKRIIAVSSDLGHFVFEIKSEARVTKVMVTGSLGHVFFDIIAFQTNLALVRTPGVPF
jgi:hypothetical protein